MGFLSQIIRLQLSFDTMGPQFALSCLRRVPDTAQCVGYAQAGNIKGLKDLFTQGLASPRDVSSTRGYSLLRVGGSTQVPASPYLTQHTVGTLCKSVRHM